MNNANFDHFELKTEREESNEENNETDRHMNFLNMDFNIKTEGNISLTVHNVVPYEMYIFRTV